MECGYETPQPDLWRTYGLFRPLLTSPYKAMNDPVDVVADKPPTKPLTSTETMRTIRPCKSLPASNASHPNNKWSSIVNEYLKEFAFELFEEGTGRSLE